MSPLNSSKPDNAGPRTWWRALEERAGDPAFQELLHNEFPSQVEAIADPVARRTFLKLMGASLALGGFTGCTLQPSEKIVPYVRQPEELIPGRPLFFATAMALGGVAIGLLVESHEGRPTKIEGNPLHPGSLGATDAFAQAAVLGLYDPDRSQTLTNLGDIRPWSAFLGELRAALAAQQPLKGAGVRILTESVSSPTLAAQIRDVLSRFPSAKWHRWDPASGEQARAGARLAFGEYVGVRYRFDRADVILALDSDFLGCGPGSVRYARDFAERRRPGQAGRMNRLYALDSMPSSTGARADHRLPVRPSEVEGLARRIAAAIGVGGVEQATGSSAGGQTTSDQTARWINAVAKDLQAHRGSSLVVAGDEQPAAVHAVAHAMNAALGNAGSTVIYTDPVEAEPADQLASLGDLVNDMNAGAVDLLVIIGGNPVYTAPADVPFGAALSKVRLRVHLGLYDDETSALCHWQIPETHFLEAWSDARAYDGTASIVQPLIAPLYNGKSAHELLAAFTDRPERSGYDIVRDYWNARAADLKIGGGDGAAAPKPGAGFSAAFESAWRRWLHDGLIPGTALSARTVAVRGPIPSTSIATMIAGAAGPRGAAGGTAPPPADGALEIVFRSDPSVLDGRFANNGWLQELPKPITKLTWDNAVLVSPKTAEMLKVGGVPSMQGGEHGQIVSDVVELRYRGRSVKGAAFVVPGHPDGCATVHLGYGRTRAGQVGSGTGFNANALRTSDAMSFGPGLQIARTGERYSLACTQYHHLMEGRGQVRAITRDEFVRNPSALKEGDQTPPKTLTLYPEHKYEGHKWGMTIDVNACIGCNACVVGCQSENNIPVVGKAQVLAGREMHWLRIDTYYRGPVDNPETYFQPVPCMQCENAPCEVVCPVGATVHSDEGLNDMVYNRCVGTRYCSNNCPYKVRRFNFLLYQDWTTPSLKLGRNPDVTVRSRGVMEKCTYCVQRINEAKIDAEKEERPLKDGDIKTACQQVCPADAIVFGDLNDPGSRVAQLQREVRNYALLAELNTRPRTTYLAVVRNVNPELGE
ncbi:MAG TPA: TAT-variant-translocated molybdopterin oxidoreductase [Vicinamibacterales bacterium]|jgi:molybdopterin-containing oxidoreductase family iron-sulfur binding subunit|nr:TAT-variant-translocated molybdopterin oxidoreductase [Vicinamibacterales bacterium]